MEHTVRRKRIDNWLTVYTQQLSTQSGIAYIWLGLSTVGTYLGHSVSLRYKDTRIYPNLWLTFFSTKTNSLQLGSAMQKYIDFLISIHVPVYRQRPSINQLNIFLLSIRNNRRILPVGAEPDLSFLCSGEESYPLVPHNLSSTITEKFYTCLLAIYKTGKYTKYINKSVSASYSEMYTSLSLPLTIDRLERNMYEYLCNVNIWQSAIPVFYSDKALSIPQSRDQTQIRALKEDLQFVLANNRRKEIQLTKEAEAWLESSIVELSNNTYHLQELIYYYNNKWNYLLKVSLILALLVEHEYVELADIQLAARILSKTEEFFPTILRNVASSERQMSRQVLETIREYGGIMSVNQLVTTLREEYVNKEELQMLIRNLLNERYLELVKKDGISFLRIIQER